MTEEDCAWEGTGWLRKWFLLFLGLSICSGAWARPPRKTLYVDEKEHDFLMNFGYIPQSDRELGSLRTDDQLRDALRNLQAFGNIPVTGEMDDATKNLMQTPRCGLPDIAQSSFRKKRYTRHGPIWHYTNLTWSLRSNYIPNLDHGQVRSELHRALDIWARHSSLSFQEVNSDRADILVYFERGYHGDGYAFDGPGQILAHAFFPGSGRGGDAHFDVDESWVMKPFANPDQHDGTSLFDVAAHEFGHSLGLGHSTVKGALMFPWYQALPVSYDLPTDDQYGIQQLYPRRDEKKKWAKKPNYEPVPYVPPKPTPPQRDPTTRRPRPPPATTPSTTTTTTVRTRVHPTHRPTHHQGGKPDTCTTTWDAISVIRGEVFIFKDLYLWRIGNKGLEAGYPVKIVRFWNSLPENMTHVDAVYERNDRNIVFFIGREYFVFDANKLLPGYPKPLTHLGLPHDLKRVDAAMVWGHNSKTYLFSGTMYWRLDEDVGHVELDYPRDMSIWRGVGYNIDTVFQWIDGKTYFFKHHMFWKFDDLRMRVAHDYPKQSAPFWLGCPPAVTTSSASAHVHTPISAVLSTLLLLYILEYKYLFLFL